MGTTQTITATFSEPMNAASVIAPGTFTVTGPGVTPVPGTVTYDATNNIATFAPIGGTFATGTTFTATITTAAESVALLPLASNYVWTFTTGAGPDTTPPLVSATDPLNIAVGVATNQKIVATFDKGDELLNYHRHHVHLDGTGSNAGSGHGDLLHHWQHRDLHSE